MRQAQIERKTKETDISLFLSLDGGEVEVSTGIGFFDHMLTALAVHAGFGLRVRCDGDLAVDGHHTVEDVGICLGQAFAKAMEDKTGITRYGTAFIPMDEALGFAAVDISGRAFLVYDAFLPEERVGEFDTCLTLEFMRSFAYNALITLHVQAQYGENAHHIIEAMFKAVAHALKAAVRPTGDGALLSTKGAL
ncbi:MAG: imidazoleglycerol-phosphate dehydratase HisB [Candidatus Howiella sp.]|jgi:imidazoleglycerol-phosphate dehydratase